MLLLYRVAQNQDQNYPYDILIDALVNQYSFNFRF